VTLREEVAGAGAEADSLSVAGESLVAIHDWTFLLGPDSGLSATAAGAARGGMASAT